MLNRSSTVKGSTTHPPGQTSFMNQQTTKQGMIATMIVNSRAGKAEAAN